MYMPYLMCGYAATVILMLAGCYAFSRTLPGLRGMRLLVAALVSGLLGVSLMALRPIAPGWLTILVANGAIFVCAHLIYSATADILDKGRSFHRWGAGALAASVAGLGYFTYVHEDLVARIYICSACFALYAAARGVLFFVYREPAVEDAAPGSPLDFLITALGWLHVAIVALQMGRIVLTALYPPTEIVHMDLLQSGFTYLNLILNAGAGLGLIWLAQAMHRRDLHRIAQTDGLTGLLNRRTFEEILLTEMQTARRTHRPVAILLIDIDRFKEVNDTWGHLAGDEVIRRVAMALRSNLRPGDSLCRFGGEEFVILLREASAQQSAEVAGRLRAYIANLPDLPGSVRLTVSIGVAESRIDDTLQELLRRCDEALYVSKRGGRNLVTVVQAGSTCAEVAPASMSA